VLGATGALAGVTVLTDPHGEVRRAYGAAGSRAFLIRPDGHLVGSVPLPTPDAVEALCALQARALGG